MIKSPLAVPKHSQGSTALGVVYNPRVSSTTLTAIQAPTPLTATVANAETRSPCCSPSTTAGVSIPAWVEETAAGRSSSHGLRFQALPKLPVARRAGVFAGSGDWVLAPPRTATP